MQIENGMRVKNVITGMEGIVTGLVFYLTGCIRALVQPDCLIDGKEIVADWVDCILLEPVGGKKIALNPFYTDDLAGPDLPAPVYPKEPQSRPTPHPSPGGALTRSK
jgi:hypothetical protein